MNNSTTTISTVVTPPNYLVLLIDWPFYIFHLSLVLFVAVRVVKRNADFSGGFYVLFLYLAGVDALSFLQLLIFFRLANNGFMIEFIVKSMFSNGIALFGYEAS
uniref:Uncharacterized protein n=1 Tax=Acrobeloides nanus TaxID=290746 RepID=A0A914E1E7_9BILA